MTEETKQKITVLLSALNEYDASPFNEVFNVVLPVYAAEDIDIIKQEKPAAMALVIWGGSDISSSLYGERASPMNGATEKLSSRDQMEVNLAHKAIKEGIPVIGICRGAQLMCALSGGKLIQHVNGHAGGYHDITLNDGRTMACPSLHHQMMYPWCMKEKWEMLAWSSKARSQCYYGGLDEAGEQEDYGNILPDGGKEPEVIWIPHTKSLCIQSHPEFIHDMSHPFIKYTLELTRKLILCE